MACIVICFVTYSSFSCYSNKGKLLKKQVLAKILIVLSFDIFVTIPIICVCGKVNSISKTECLYLYSTSFFGTLMP